MGIISKETWEKFTEEERKRIRNAYKILDENNTEARLAGEYVYIFGKENLQPKIKTWNDVATYNPELWNFINRLCKEIANCPYIDNKLYKKLIATIQIQKLIEFGYGGMITEEEWMDGRKSKAVIKRTTGKSPTLYYATVYYDVRFIAFHTDEQREKFVSHPENVELIKQYYMM